MPLPLNMPIGPLAIAANAYWALNARFRIGAAMGAGPICRDALSGLIELHAAEAWPAPIHSRANARIPALVAELAQIERPAA